MISPRYTFPALLIAGLLAASPSLPAAGDDSARGWEVGYWNLVNLYGTRPRLNLPDSKSEQGIPLHEPLFPVMRTLYAVSPALYGFRGSAEIHLQPGPYSDTSRYGLAALRAADPESASYQVLAKAMYSGSIGPGNVNVWLGASWQDQLNPNYTTVDNGTSDGIGYNVGVDLNLAGFSLSGSYFDGDARDPRRFNQDLRMNSNDCAYLGCRASDQAGYMVSGGYTFRGSTRLGISYTESNRNTYLTGTGLLRSSAELWTVGLYHDLNSRFQFMTEISDYVSSTPGEEDSRAISVGGYLRW